MSSNLRSFVLCDLKIGENMIKSDKKDISDVKFIENSVSEVSRLGISKIIREAEEHGLSIMTKNGEPIAMLVPLSIAGFNKYLDIFQLLGETDQDPTVVRDFANYLRKELQKVEDIY